MGDAANVLVGADGGVNFAPSGTTIPTTVEGALDGAFTDLGFVSDDGLTEAIGTSTNQIKNWKGDTVREVQTEHTVTYKFVLIETNDDSEEVFYGDDPANGIEAVQGTRGRWVFDIFDGDIPIRVVVPDGQVTERGDVVYKNDQAIAYDITVTAYPDATNKKAYRYRGTGS
jgi:hypothetical protein